MRAAVARVRLDAMPLQWIVFAALFIAFAIFAAVTTYWPDIIAQPASAAAFLGALAGAGGGLLAIILGALINAELNRYRDDRLRRKQAHAVAVALVAELEGFARDCRATHKALQDRAREGISVDTLRSYDIAEELLSKVVSGLITRRRDPGVLHLRI